jgi:putative ATPase
LKPPLPEQLRPKCLSEVVGQDHLLGEKGVLTRTIKSEVPLSIVLWGPPGTGKTTIAMLYARAFHANFVNFSAVLSGVADLRKVVKDADDLSLLNQQTVLFVDEIHRFNKAQQDAFLPHLENGTFILVGATTENPSFALNNPLLSRLRVLTLNYLDDNGLGKILDRYEKLRTPLPLNKEARNFLIKLAQGDGRYLLNNVENLENLKIEGTLDLKALEEILQKRSAHYDRGGEGHFNLISALHKAIRGSDPDASLYWFSRMMEGGEDPMYLARRLIRMASEDVGLADPQALCQTVAARDAYSMLGSPEGELSLAQAVVYLAMAPKSNGVYSAYKSAREIAKHSTQLPPPSHILNAPTQVMKKLGMGKGYIYDHDTPHGFSGQNYFPDNMERLQFYFPVERGFEREMIKRQNYFSKLRLESGGGA